MIDSNMTIHEKYKNNNHLYKQVTPQGFTVDRSSNGSLSNFLTNTNMIDVMTPIHDDVPGTQLSGNRQIDHILISKEDLKFVAGTGMFKYNSIFSSDHKTQYIDLRISDMLDTIADQTKEPTSRN